MPDARDAAERAAIQRAGEALARQGAEVEVWRHDSLRRSLDIWLRLMDETEGWTFAQIMGNGEAVRLRRELALALLGRSEHILPALALCTLAFLMLVPRRGSGTGPL